MMVYIFIAAVTIIACLAFYNIGLHTDIDPKPKPIQSRWKELNRCLGCDSGYPLGSILRHGDEGFKPIISNSNYRWVCPVCGAHSSEVVRKWIGKEKTDGSYEWKSWSDLPEDLRPKIDPTDKSIVH